jgi:hypothetical protein
VQTEFPCNHRTNELTKFIKESEKNHRCSIDSTPFIYKVSRSNSWERKSSKKDKNSDKSNLTNMSEIYLFLV